MNACIDKVCSSLNVDILLRNMENIYFWSGLFSCLFTSTENNFLSFVRTQIVDFVLGDGLVVYMAILQFNSNTKNVCEHTIELTNAQSFSSFGSNQKPMNEKRRKRVALS